MRGVGILIWGLLFFKKMMRTRYWFWGYTFKNVDLNLNFFSSTLFSIFVSSSATFFGKYNKYKMSFYTDDQKMDRMRSVCWSEIPVSLNISYLILFDHTLTRFFRKRFTVFVYGTSEVSSTLKTKYFKSVTSTI